MGEGRTTTDDATAELLIAPRRGGDEAGKDVVNDEGWIQNRRVKVLDVGEM